MKKLLFLLILSFGSGLLAQEAHWVNPLPFGNEPQDMEFFDEQRGILCARSAGMAFTEDGGESWTISPTESKSDFMEIKIIGEGVAYCWTKLELLKTIDYGKNWEIVHKLVDGKWFMDLFFFDEQQAYCLINDTKNECLHFSETNDGGLQWRNKRAEGLNEFNYSWLYGNTGGMAFESKTKGILFFRIEDHLNEIFYTANAADSFTRESPYTFSDKDFRDIVFVGDSSYFLCGSYGDYKANQPFWGGAVYKTTDFGQNWLRVVDEYLSYASLHRIKSNGDSVLVAYGFNSGYGKGYPSCIVSSHDYGNTWEINEATPISFQYLLSSSRICALAFQNSSKLLAYLSDVIHTRIRTDSLPIWQAEKIAYENTIDDIGFFDGQQYLVSDDILIQVNGYFPYWDTLSVPGSLYAAVYDEEELVLISTFYHETLAPTYFLKATDGNLNWEQKLMYPGDRFGVDHVLKKRGDELFILFTEKYTSREFYYLANWESETKLLPLPLVDTVFSSMDVSEKMLFLFGEQLIEGAGYYYSSDLGQQWHFRDIGLDFIDYGFAKSDDEIYVFDTATHYLWLDRFSQNAPPESILEIEGGDHIVDIIQKQDGRMVLLSDLNTPRYIAGNSFIFLEQSEGVYEKMGPFPRLNGLALDPDGQHVWAYGRQGRLLYIGEGLPVGLSALEDPEPSVFKIYGNPISHNLEFSVNLDFQGEALLQVVDMNGKLVQENRIILQGQAARFLVNTSRLPSGICVCSLIAGDKRFSEKIVKE